MSQTIMTRLEDLYDALEYCSNEQTFGKPASFTALERICINQERGSLLSQINKETAPDDIRYYKCPPKLEIKIRFTIQKVTDINLITN